MASASLSEMWDCRALVVPLTWAFTGYILMLRISVLCPKKKVHLSPWDQEASYRAQNRQDSFKLV